MWGDWETHLPGLTWDLDPQDATFDIEAPDQVRGVTHIFAKRGAI